MQMHTIEYKLIQMNTIVCIYDNDNVNVNDNVNGNENVNDNVQRCCAKKEKRKNKNLLTSPENPNRIKI